MGAPRKPDELLRAGLRVEESSLDAPPRANIPHAPMGSALAMSDLPGLSAAQAAARLAQDGANVLPQARRSSPGRLLWLTVREPMVLMLLAAGALYFTLGDPAEALMLMVAVVGVVALTLSQSLRSQRALEALRDLSAPRALVVRDGLAQRVASAELVVGDLLVLREGDRIAADALLLDGQLRVDESLLTGESEPQQKLPAGVAGELYCGTLVTQGLGRARVRATGSRSSMGQIGESLRDIAEGATPLQQASAQLVRRVAALGLAISVAVVLLAWLWDRRPVLESLLLGIATAMAILPEEIPVVLTIFLALGAWRLSQRSVLTRRLSAIETLGSVTVLAVDKTGTLTHNRMRVTALSTLAQRYLQEGPLPEAFHTLLEFAWLATPQDPFDPMEKALGDFARQHLARTERAHPDWVPVRAYALSPEILAMTHAYAPDAQGLRLLATKGAPEAVADLCHLSPVARERLRAEVQALAGQGLRVLGVARGVWDGPSWPASQHDFRFEFLGLVGFLDPPREDVGAALAQCRTAGIRVMMLTGDHPTTALAIARQIGLPEGAEVLTGDELDGLSEPALRERLSRTALCARVRPQHKLRLVRALQAQGEVVAMTGDGVNDGPALRAANVGIAMGQRGTDVAREAAAIVLLDDSFASIIDGIRQGRLIDRNLRRAIAFVFAVHVPIVLLSLAPVAMHWPILLLPAQIVLMELLIDPACSVYFEAEPPRQDLMREPPRASADSALGLPILVEGLKKGVAAALVLLAGAGILSALDVAEAQLRSTVFLALVLGSLAQLAQDRGHVPRGQLANPWLPRILGGVALMLAIIFLPHVRSVVGLDLPSPALALAACALGLAQWGAIRLAGAKHKASRRRP
jgi:Ca2+-transporting ATPase